MKRLILIATILTVILSGCTENAPTTIDLDATIQAGIDTALNSGLYVNSQTLEQSQMAQNTQIAYEMDVKLNALSTAVYEKAQQEISQPEIVGTPTLSIGSHTLDNCINQFEFLSDVTFPDGTMTLPGTTFTKSWYIINTGTCEWTRAYSIVYLSGDNVATAKEFPLFTSDKLLKPNESTVASVKLTAPQENKEYATYWGLKAPDGTIFKGGKSAEGYPLSSKFKVGKEYNFYENLGGAICEDDSGLFYCGSSDRTSGRGVAYYSQSPTVESNYAGQPSIIIAPPLTENGTTRVTFGPVMVSKGTWMRASLSCPPNAPNCNCDVRLYVQAEGLNPQIVTETQEFNDGFTSDWNIQLSNYGYHDQSLTYTFEVQANGGSDLDDMIIIQIPRLSDQAPIL